MRRVAAVLFALLLIGGASTAVAPVASASADGCGLVGDFVAPAEDDCRTVLGFVVTTRDLIADDVFFVFCTVFPTHPSCV